jgi:SAM-dependent methyltransferase
LRAGLTHVDVRKTPGLLALVSSARKPLDTAALPIRELVTSFASLIQKIPVSLAVREAQRLVVLLKKLPDNCEVWDVGCGDGSFWKVYQRGAGVQVDGVDLNAHEVELARQTGVYRRLDVADVSVWRPEASYDVVVGNCSLEHVPDIHSALINIRHALRPDGQLLLFVPAFGWVKTMPWVRRLGKVSSRLEMAFAGMLDGFFQHHHIYDQNTWQLVIEAAGFDVVEAGALGSEASNRVFRRRLPVAALEFCYKTLFKRYPQDLYQRALPGADFFAQLAEQPVRVDSPHKVEYVFVAKPRTAR